jgi:hypothetical protein
LHETGSAVWMGEFQTPLPNHQPEIKASRIDGGRNMMILVIAAKPWT